MRIIISLVLILLSNCNPKSKNSDDRISLAGLSLLTSSSSNIYLYSTGAPINGAFGNRTTADALCVNRKNDPSISSRVFGLNTKAFVSYSSSDEIRGIPESYNLPTNFPIRSPNNIIIADNWKDFLNGDLTITLMAANVIRDPAVVRIWTFSTVNGAFNSTNNCSSGLSTAGNGAQWNMSALSYTMDSLACNNATVAELLCLSY